MNTFVIHTYIRTFIHTYIHTHTHTYIHYSLRCSDNKHTKAVLFSLQPGHFIPQFTTIKWALCVPASCSYADVQQTLVEALHNYNQTIGLSFDVHVDPEMCYVKHATGNPLSSGTIITLWVPMARDMATLWLHWGQENRCLKGHSYPRLHRNVSFPRPEFSFIFPSSLLVILFVRFFITFYSNKPFGLVDIVYKGVKGFLTQLILYY